MSSDGPADDRRPAPSDAFHRLGNETRMAVLGTLADGEPRTFSSLFDASDEDTSAGFAYHLRQLDGRFVRQREDDRYELTYAGRQVVDAVRAGTYTESVDRDAVVLDAPCPLCDRPELVARVADNVTAVGCEACGGTVLRMSFPPSGYAGRDDADLPGAFDAYHRRRIAAFADGVCPDCGGRVHASVEPARDAAGTESSDGGGDPSGEGGTRTDPPLPVRLRFDCETCGGDLQCPVSLAVLDHPAVVAFYHGHGRDVRDRPIWNVGGEWAERVLSRDPWCVRVSTRLDGDELALFVAGDGRVVDHRRLDSDDDGPSAAAEHDVDGEGESEAGRADPPEERASAGDESAGADGAAA